MTGNRRAIQPRPGVAQRIGARRGDRPSAPRSADRDRQALIGTVAATARSRQTLRS